MTVHNFTAYTERTAGTLPASFRHVGSEPSQDFQNHLSDIQKAENYAETGQKLPSAEKNEDTWSFWDIIDVINPLQHIPIVSTLYRAITGDEINNTARILGGAVFGGVAGAAMGVANAIVDESTGKDIGENVFALLKNDTISKPHQPDMPNTETNTLFAQENNQESTIEIAENNIREEDIIWASIQKDKNKLEFPQLEYPTPTLPNHTLIAGMTKPTALHSNVSVDSPKGIEAMHNAFADMTRNKEEEILSAKPYVASHTIPNNPKAQLREAEEISLPPELIAQRMMEALDKYGALKKNQFSAFSQL